MRRNLSEVYNLYRSLKYEKGIKVFFDVNYRPALSTPEMAFKVLNELAMYIYCLITNEEHLKMLSGISTEYGEINGMSVWDTVEFGAASCAFKHTVHGDTGFASADEIMAVIKGNTDVKR